MRILSFLSIVTGIVALTGCADSVDVETTVPVRNVYYTLPYAQSQALMSSCLNYTMVGTDELVYGQVVGLTGLLLCHDASTLGKIHAYDPTCPACYPQSTVAVECNGLSAVCPKCHSEFNQVFFGSGVPTAGPANSKGLRLTTYQASYIAQDGKVFVHN